MDKTIINRDDEPKVTKDERMKQHTYGYIYAVIAAFLYALIAIIGKDLISGGTHPLQVTFYQYLFTVLMLGAGLLIRKPAKLRDGAKKLHLFAMLGIIGGGGTTLLFFFTLQYLDAGVSSMLLFIHPVYITLFFAITKIKKLNLTNYISVFITVIGAAIVLDVFSGSLKLSAIGIILGILSGMTYAFYNVFADLKLKAEDPNVINFYASTSSLLLSALLTAASGVGFSVSYNDLLPILFLAGFSGILPAYFIFTALHYIGSEKVSVVASVELPMTLIMAFTILGEHMKPVQLFGVVLIILAAVLLHYHETKD